MKTHEIYKLWKSLTLFFIHCVPIKMFQHIVSTNAMKRLVEGTLTESLWAKLLLLQQNAYKNDMTSGFVEGNIYILDTLCNIEVKSSIVVSGHERDGAGREAFLYEHNNKRDSTAAAALLQSHALLLFLERFFTVV